MDSKVDFNAVIANVLRYGVTSSSLLIAIGLLMILLGDRSHNFPTLLSELLKINYGRPSLELSKLVVGVVSLNSISIIQLGLLVLLSTPIVRVAASIILFAAQGDAVYVYVTVFVLAVLLFSIFVVGPIEAS
ncbi:MAG: DUF1634 domain-containing protein [Nitrososphaerales archaeon]